MGDNLLRGQDLSLVVTDAMGAPVVALSEGIEDFNVNPVLESVEHKNLDKRQVSQVFNGWKGDFNLNMKNTAVMTFIDRYVRLVAGKTDFRVTLSQKVWDAQLEQSREWVYPKCTLDFKEGPYNRTSPVKQKVSFDTGEQRIPR